MVTKKGLKKMVTKKYEVPGLKIYVEITRKYEWQCDITMQELMNEYHHKYKAKTVEVKETAD